MTWTRESPYCLTSGPWSIAWFYTGETVALMLSKNGKQVALKTGIPRDDTEAKRRELEAMKKEAEK